MGIQYGIGLSLGVAVGNLFIYKFLWGMPWLSATGIGGMAGLICFALWGLFRLLGLV